MGRLGLVQTRGRNPECPKTYVFGPSVPDAPLKPKLRPTRSPE